jgi:hypothetical protein
MAPAVITIEWKRVVYFAPQAIEQRLNVRPLLRSVSTWKAKPDRKKKQIVCPGLRRSEEFHRAAVPAF